MTSSIEWQAPEFEYRPKDISWYWLSIFITLIFLGAAIWQRNFLFGVFVVVGEILVMSWANREPRNVQFKLGEGGLEIAGEKVYPYTDMASFSAYDGNEARWPHVVIRFQKRLRVPLAVGVPREKSESIKGLLKSFVPQTDPESSLLESLEKFIGF